MLAMEAQALRAVRQPAFSLTTIVGTPPGACSLLQVHVAIRGLLFEMDAELAPLLLTPRYPLSERQKIAGRQRE